jgi:hypothetical protein
MRRAGTPDRVREAILGHVKLVETYDHARRPGHPRCHGRLRRDAHAAGRAPIGRRPRARRWMSRIVAGAYSHASVSLSSHTSRWCARVGDRPDMGVNADVRAPAARCEEWRA